MNAHRALETVVEMPKLTDGSECTLVGDVGRVRITRPKSVEEYENITNKVHRDITKNILEKRNPNKFIGVTS